MGIQGLLKVMRPYIEAVHIRKYAGKRVGIDAYSWLHKGAYACSMELCQQALNTRNTKLPYLQYFMHRINMLRYYKVTPVVVFDGGHLPSKAATEEERQRRRDAYLEQARTKLAEGDVKGAIELFQRAVHITPFMANELIQILKTEGVEFVVAPYEADAQLAYLSRLDPEKGGIVAVISEDSDLMAYGCNVVIYKMDRSGDGEEVIMDKVFNCLTVPARELSFKCFTQELFTADVGQSMTYTVLVVTLHSLFNLVSCLDDGEYGMCVLAGCDFLSSVPGIGIKRAHSLVLKYKNIDRVLSVLQLDKKRHIPEGYVNSFKEANAVFHHARVYDADMRCLSFLKPLPEGFSQALDGNLDFLGPELPSSMVIAIAEGRLDPITMEAFDEFPQIPSSLGHQAVYANETAIFQNQSRESKIKKDGGPFVLLSEKTQDEFCVQTGEEPLQELTYTAHRKKVNKTKLEVNEGVAETECFLPSQKACELDRGLMTHFRAVAEHSSLTRSSLHMDDNQVKNNGIALEVKGQKRVFPPTPDNNPFKRKKSEDRSVSLADSLGTSSLQGASKTDYADAHLSELSKKSQGNKRTAAEVSLKSILPKSESRITKYSNKPHSVIPPGNEQELLSTINNLACSEAVLYSDTVTPIPLSDGPSSTQVIQRTVLAPKTQQGMNGVNTKSTATPKSSSPSRGTDGKRTSSSTKPKTGTKGNRASSTSKNLATKNSGILKFFNKV